MLVPSSRRVQMEVQSGPGKGLILDVNPRWEHPFLEGEYESEVQDWVMKICRPGVTFFDVGANFGYYSMLATRYGANAIAFEPDSANAQPLVIACKTGNDFGDRIKPSASGRFFLTTGRASAEVPLGVGIRTETRMCNRPTHQRWEWCPCPVRPSMTLWRRVRLPE